MRALVDLIGRCVASGRWAALAAALTLFAAEAPAQEEPTPVGVDAVGREVLAQTVPVIGRLVALRTGEVATEVGAVVVDVRVEIGSRVEKGEVVALLNRDRFAAIRDQRAAELETAKALLSVRQQEVALARQALARLEGLKESAAFSQANYEDKRQEVAVAVARVAVARADIATAEANLRLAELDLAHTEVVAPYDGAVVQRMAEAGVYMQTGDPVVRLLSDTDLEIEAEVPTDRVTGLSPGREVRIVLDDGTRHGAAVKAIVPAENPLTRTRPVRFTPDIGETEKPLADGQSVTVHVPIGEPRQVLTVHKDGVLQRPQGPAVFVIEGDVAQPRPVELGQAVGNRFEVLGGLEEGELVVVRGNERLRPGQRVILQESGG